MNQWVVCYLLVVPVLIWVVRPSWPAWMRVLRLVLAAVACYVLIQYAYAANLGMDVARLRPESLRWAVSMWWCAAVFYVGLWNAAWEWFMRSIGQAPEAHPLNYISMLFIAAACTLLVYSLVQHFLFNDGFLPVIMPLALPGVV